MKKAKIMLGVFLGLSLSALAAVELNSGEVEQKEGMFITKNGEALEGEYKMRNMNFESDFTFQQGKIQEFSFDSKEEDNFEIDGKFIDNQKYFKGEVSIQQVLNNDPERKGREDLSLDGSMDAKDIAEFARDLLIKKEADWRKPSFAEVSGWKMQNGEREVEKEFVRKVDKQGDSGKFMMLGVEKTGEKQVYSSGKVVHTSQLSASTGASNVEKKIKTQ